MMVALETTRFMSLPGGGTSLVLENPEISLKFDISIFRPQSPEFLSRWLNVV